MQDQEKSLLISNLEATMRRFVRGFRRELNDQLGEGFTSSELSFLRTIKEKKCHNVSSLASTLNVSNSHATSVMDRLVEKSLIVRTRSKKDRRVVVFMLTEEGERMYQTLDQKRESYMQQRFERLSKEEIQELIRIFNLL
ncbi:MarR family transcriptional regulator [Halobacillus shinanisalinarum]|uniref:MarR family transcriptional regulator n=1 Tax=Halobacillus shinanisalinarum TaxID=2932258 RepID=A0ABY4GUN1_9BACI|nr:MarR family transcriptional regulator [Halobacillus shinanisalinarum]UOQ91608.1 MarR family transcriptional regulator [Halobacillus shinanisalinarum]